MRGLIYKDISIFFKSIDKKLILIAAAAIVLLIFNAGIYAGLFASVMFAMTKYSLQGTTQGNGLTGGVPPVRFSM